MIITLTRAMTLQNAINSLPAEGGTIYIPNGTYDVPAGVILPSKQLPGYVSNIRIQGESSGLACGSVGNAFGVRFNFSGSGSLFKASGRCINLQFRDFEAVDMNGSQQTIGLDVENFGTGCIVENVGFKGFWKSGVFTGENYYCKFDRMVSFGARDTGFEIHAPNMTEIHRCQASYGGGTGLKVFNGLGAVVTSGWFENNTVNGVVVDTGHVVVQNSYFEQNTLGDINLGACAGGEISGNIRVQIPGCLPFVQGTRLSTINIHGNTEI